MQPLTNASLDAHQQHHVGQCRPHGKVKFVHGQSDIIQCYGLSLRVVVWSMLIFLLGVGLLQPLPTLPDSPRSWLLEQGPFHPFSVFLYCVWPELKLSLPAVKTNPHHALSCWLARMASGALSC